MEKKSHLKQLDALRGGAAFYVVLHHFVDGLDFIPNSLKKMFFSFGQEAVMLFFLLSGFVIYWSVEHSFNITFKSYLIKRFRRIYFPFVIALIVSMIIIYLKGTLTEEFSWSNLIGNLFMLQDFSSVKPGTWFKPFLANDPLWSLSYEWWFYLLFFPSYKLLPKNLYRIYFVLSFSAIFLLIYILIPNQASLWLSYFIIWWSGVELAEIYIKQGKFTPKNTAPIIFSILFMLSLTLIPVLYTEEIKLGYYPFLIFRHFLAVFLFLILGLIWHQNKLLFFDDLIGGFALIAPISYGIYIFHYPILKYTHLEQYFSPFWLGYIIQFGLIIGLAYVVELKIQPWIYKWLK